jgi:MYXO-CTERM domain-containing protein
MTTRSTMLAAIALLWCAALAHASIHTFDANLDGLQEVPPNASPAFGSATATLDDGSGTFTIVTGSYNDLLGGSFAVSLFDAPVGTNGPLILALTLDTPGAATGTFSGGGPLTPAQIADVVAGKGYLNIRSQVFPSGEIRGQLFETPEPTSFVMAALAGIGWLAAARRRRAS